MISLQIAVRVDPVVARLDRLSRRLQDQTPELLHTVDQLLSIEESRFAADDELANHRRLLRSLTERDSPLQVLAVGSDSLTFGSRSPYLDFHTTNRGGAPIVGLTRVEETAVRAEFRRRLLEGL